MIEFIEYNKCSTCKKAKQFLDSNNIKYNDRPIKDKTPTKKELSNWIKKYNVNINKLFNTSGLVYKSLNLKDKIQTLSNSEKINLLSNNGMLLKRPLLITDEKLLIGFKEEEWDKIKNDIKN